MTTSSFYVNLTNACAIADQHAQRDLPTASVNDLEWDLGLESEGLTIDELTLLKMVYDQYRALYVANQIKK
ncbi:hypothetical protein [Hymenobacter sublimis]|uniref:Orphan protein n=1 Tax=Hymenobacter sublimis TaxID=2933777 RepID=A0ABY4JGS0_9BACT|nr:hypothetical protein [Hymenobacter sublimis]UPL50519.1 hypothetical protein MWH26_06330 [Hymenobacter sublimis]